MTSITTVGYGDKLPLSAGGRAVAAVLMLIGIGLIATITAGIAAVFIKSLGGSGHPASPDTVDRDAMPEILTRLAAIEASLALLTTDSRFSDKPASLPQVEYSASDSRIASDWPDTGRGDQAVATKSS